MWELNAQVRFPCPKRDCLLWLKASRKLQSNRQADRWRRCLLSISLAFGMLTGWGGSVPERELLADDEGQQITNSNRPIFKIHVVDEQTGRGVPLVELETVHHVRFVTDNQGLIAIDDPQFLGERVFFHIRSHGYQYPTDGLGMTGRAFDLQPGGAATIRLQRTNIAERLYRVTGQGLYRDSLMLGVETPLKTSHGSGRVVGQDSVSAVPYQGRIYWFWGDTSRLSYPLGHFWMAGAVSDRPGQGGLDPADGVDLRYFVDETGFSRPVCRLGVAQGPIWADTFATVQDDRGNERLVCHYAHMESLGKLQGHGLAVFNDESEEFERLLQWELNESWRFPAQAHPVRIEHEGRTWLQFGSVCPTVRVPAELKAIADLEQYEYFTCLTPDCTPDQYQVCRDADGHLQYRWARHTLPMDETREWELLQSGVIKPDELHFNLREQATGKPIRLHRGSVNWNPYRQRWILIAGQLQGTSALGEIWYAEGDESTGPWSPGVKIVTHDQYSFYNPKQHPFFDQQGGRIVYFEGTYTTLFSGQQRPTPRYDYNQIMYRLDLNDPRLQATTE